MCKVIKNTIYICLILFFICLSSYEIKTILQYKNNNFVIKTETEKYNFVAISSIMNIFNSLFLLILFFKKYPDNFLVYLILILLINVILGLWCCLIFYSIIFYGRFENNIIIELKIFYSKIILFIFSLIIKYFSSKNQENSEILENLIDEPIINK